MMRFHPVLCPSFALALRRLSWTPIALLSALLACQGAPPVDPDTGAGDPKDPATDIETEARKVEEPIEETVDDREARAIAHIRSGEYEDARGILTDLLVEGHLACAEELLATGTPEDALLALDEVLALDPRHGAGTLLKAHASLALAESAMTRGGGALLVEGSLLDALEYYGRSGNDVDALLGASRSAWYLGRPEEALEFAKRAMARLEGGPEPAGLRLVPERVLSEAAFSAYVAAKSAEAAAETTRACFVEAETALAHLCSRAGTDPWVWCTLSDLYLWEEMLDDARGMLKQGLDLSPTDEGLLRRLADVARRAGGAKGAADAFAELNARHPDVPLAIWHQAIESFNVDVEAVMATFAEDYEPPAEPEALPLTIDATEGLFRHCRELEPTYADSCRGYEVMCRAALGWARYAEDDYNAAVAAFRSMEDVFERGMEWQLEGRLLSGVIGLHLCAKDQGEAGDPLTAGEIYEVLHAYHPEDENWANNAGFFLRDAGVAFEALGKRLCAAAEGELTSEETLAMLREAAEIDPALAGKPEEKAAFEAKADEAMAIAREIMVRSDAAYRRAAVLAADDVRIVNDMALILVYYLHTDLEFAEEILMRCVAMGEAQLANEELTEEDRFQIANAWGDAHENLGVLYAVHRRDAAQAIPWFEKAAEIGPNPRPNVTNLWLPGLRELAADADPDILDMRAWGQPCGTTGR